MRTIKRAFDPENRMNPGKIVDIDREDAEVAEDAAGTVRGARK